MSTFISVTGCELATILAALRYHQAENLQSTHLIPDTAIREIATGGGRMRALTALQIDALCQRINTADPPEVWIAVTGGVADIAKKPRGIQVCIFDYDIEGTDRTDRDPQGKPCITTISPASQSIGMRHRRGRP